MNALRSLWHRLGALLHRKQSDEEMNREIEQHLAGLTSRYEAEGMSPEQARQAALQEFGGVEQIKERARAERVWMWPVEFSRDLRYALRMLAKNPGFTFVAVMALALGIGANSAIFSVIDAVLLRPLPYKNAAQLVTVWEEAKKLGFPFNTPSPANFLDWREQNSVFSCMAATADKSFNLTGRGEPERLDGERVSANLFPLLGAEPFLGRSFLPEEDAPGKGDAVVLSYGLWQRRFGAASDIIGKPIVLNGASYRVVGVMPRDFVLPGHKDQLWVPLAFDSKEAASRGNHYLRVIARLKPGVSMEAARSQMSTIAARLAHQYPEFNSQVGSVIRSMREEVVGDVRPALLVLLGAVGCVLLIACANVANLLLARAAVRQKEIALRLALGAGRSRLVRQFLTESLLLGTLGGVFGLLLAGFGLEVLRRFIPNAIPHPEAIGIDLRVFLFAILISALTALAFGLVPAMQALRFDLNATLKEGGRDSSSGAGRQRLRSMLIVGEIAVSFVLLIGAGLLINSFLHLRNLDPGFRSENLLAMKVDLPELKYSDPTRRSTFYEELLRRVRELPGVSAAAVASNLPLTYDGDSIDISVEGQPDPPPNERPSVITRVVSPGYFETMGIPLVRGHEFTAKDNEKTVPGVVISEKTARYFWPNENPLGKRLKPGSSTSSSRWRQVIGIVKDVRQNDFVADPGLQIYLAYRQVDAFPPNALVLRTTVDPMSLGPAVRRVVQEVDKDQPVSDIRTMSEIVSAAVARQRFSMLLLGIFAAVALTLAGIGIYGVMSYSVAQRTREIGIRMALGAQKSDVLKMTIGQGLQLVIVGVVIGLAAALVLTRVMSSLLFGVSATDPTTFVTISLILLSVALTASYVPALRSMKVDPVIALRYQ